MSERHTMSPADAAWLHMDRPTNLMVINVVLLFEAAVDWDQLQAVFLEQVVERFPRFRQRIHDGLPGRLPTWVDDGAFEPERHFHRLGVPAPGDRTALQALVSDLASTPLDRTKPLWDLYLLEGYSDGCAVLGRMHHAIADGIALARVMLSMTDGAGEPNGIPPSPRPLRHSRALRPGRLVLEAGTLVLRQGLATVRDPGRLLGGAATAGRDAASLMKLLAPIPERPSSLKGDLLVTHRVAWSDPVSLAAVKRVGRSLDATVNDVLVAAVAGAVRDHLRKHGEATPDLHALVPFNLRPPDEPLPRDLGNRFGLLLLGLPVHIEDPIERVRAVQHEMASIKRSHEGLLAYGILSALGRTPPPVESRLVDFFSAKGSMVLTNVPGPRRAITLAGAPVAGVLVWAPCSGSLGMSVSVFSYAGRVTVGFLADAALVPDPQALADAFRAEVRRLDRRTAAMRLPNR